ncbi:MAG: hypothetical protein KF758_09550 [Anaerolineales bacterium]|nr:hypothetical protein [Anaerolineales bacterium]
MTYKIYKSDQRYSQDSKMAISTGSCIARFTYLPSSESLNEKALNQDYLTFAYNSKTFMFAICDGVGQSFMGEIASSFLGDSLLTWLTEKIDFEDIYNQNAYLDNFYKYINGLKIPASKIINNYPLPNSIGEIQKLALEGLREEGSQTTFLCGRIDQVSENLPYGRLLFFWAGDTVLQLWDKFNNPLIKHSFSNETIWSTKNGIIGNKINIFIDKLYNNNLSIKVDKIRAFSDGAKSFIAQNQNIDTYRNDDVSLLELWIEEVVVSEPIIDNQVNEDEIEPSIEKGDEEVLVSEPIIDNQVNEDEIEPSIEKGDEEVVVSEPIIDNQVNEDEIESSIEKGDGEVLVSEPIIDIQVNEDEIEPSIEKDDEEVLVSEPIIDIQVNEDEIDKQAMKELNFVVIIITLFTIFSLIWLLYNNANS